MMKWMSWRTLYRSLTWAFAAVTLVAVYVPATPYLPCRGLDCSWAFAMCQAIEQRMVIGRDILFTYGPYASIATRIYTPHTYGLMLAGSIFLVLTTLAMLTVVFWRRTGWFVAYAAFLALTPPTDATLFGIPLLAVLALEVLAHTGRIQKQDPKMIALLATIFAPLGLLPLIKTTLLISCTVAIILSFLRLRMVARPLAPLALIVPTLSTFAWWTFARQPIAWLPLFFARSVPIILGYSGAMSLYTDSHTDALFGVLASVSVLLGIAFLPSRFRESRWALLAIFFVFYFLAFKEGFVREDEHLTIFAQSIMLAALLYAGVLSRGAGWPLLITMFAFVHINSNHANSTSSALIIQVETTYKGLFHGISTQIQHPETYTIAYRDHLQEMARQHSLPQLDGSVDIYSFNQSDLIASGDHWNPRPVFQSYSVYTPWLAELNQRHLLQTGAPQYILLNIEPTDHQLPSLADGLSWPVFLADYAPIGLPTGYLLLQRCPDAPHTPLLEEVAQGRGTFNSNLTVPRAGEPIYARVTLTPTFLGRIWGLLYKPGRVVINLTMASGEQRSFRYIPGMGSSWFMLSPLVEKPVDFSRLYANRGSTSAVLAMALEPSAAWPWRQTYSFSLATQNLPDAPCQTVRR